MTHSTLLVSDTSVLINFLRVERMDLIERLDVEVLITEHVVNEVSKYYANQCETLVTSLQRRIVTQVVVNQVAEVDLFNKIMSEGRLGVGEASAIAYSIKNNCSLAVDDKKAAREAKIISPELKILTTQDLMISMIQQGIIDLDEADDIKNTWETKHRFKLNINSFMDVVEN